MRAREHFRWADIRYCSNGPNTSYFGLASNLTFQYEVPFRGSLGLFFQFGGANRTGQAVAGVGDDLGLIQTGVEGKFFFRPGKPGLFGRVAIGSAWLNTKGSTFGTLFGGGFYTGFGWEFLKGKVGIAPELGYRHLYFENVTRFRAFTPSIAFHFYVFPGDREEISK